MKYLAFSYIDDHSGGYMRSILRIYILHMVWVYVCVFIVRMVMMTRMMLFSFCDVVFLLLLVFAEPATSLDANIIARALSPSSFLSSISIHNFYFITFFAHVFSSLSLSFFGLFDCFIMVLELLCCCKWRVFVFICASISVCKKSNWRSIFTFIHSFIRSSPISFVLSIEQAERAISNWFCCCCFFFVSVVLVYTQTLLTCCSIVCHTFVVSANCDFGVCL